MSVNMFQFDWQQETKLNISKLKMDNYVTQTEVHLHLEVIIFWFIYYLYIVLVKIT